MADKAEYIHTNLNRGRWCNMLNEKLFDQFLSFCDSSLLNV